MQALGVTAGITPFNFPAMVPLWMWPMAIVCGNTFVLKPSERDPSSALAHRAARRSKPGLPPGVLNVVHGGKEAVDALLARPHHPGHQLRRLDADCRIHLCQGLREAGKRVQALGGAKNHAVVMPDADIGNAVNALMGAAYGSCGERCMAIPIVVAVGDATGRRHRRRSITKPRSPSMKVGPGTDAKNDMGPLVTKEHFEKVKGYVDQGVKEGATLDGRRPRREGARARRRLLPRAPACSTT